MKLTLYAASMTGDITSTPHLALEKGSGGKWVAVRNFYDQAMMGVLLEGEPKMTIGNAAEVAPAVKEALAGEMSGDPGMAEAVSEWHAGITKFLSELTVKSDQEAFTKATQPFLEYATKNGWVKDIGPEL